MKGQEISASHEAKRNAGLKPPVSLGHHLVSRNSRFLYQACVNIPYTWYFMDYLTEASLHI